MFEIWAYVLLPLSCVAAVAGIVVAALGLYRLTRGSKARVSSSYVAMDDADTPAVCRPTVLLVVGLALLALGLAGIAAVLAVSLTSAGTVAAGGASRAAVVSPADSFTVPAGAVVMSDLETAQQWSAAGSASGVATTSSGGTRTLSFSFANGNNNGRMFSSFGTDTTSTEWVVDFRVQLPDPANVGAVSFDVNQVLATGETVKMVIQCSAWNGVWQFSHNAGTAAAPATAFVNSAAPCNPRSWGTTWHHVQARLSRIGTTVRYVAVALDGVVAQLGTDAVAAGYVLGWGKGALVTEIGMAGFGATGTAKVVVDGVSISLERHRRHLHCGNHQGDDGDDCDDKGNYFDDKGNYCDDKGNYCDHCNDKGDHCNHCDHQSDCDDDAVHGTSDDQRRSARRSFRRCVGAQL